MVKKILFICKYNAFRSKIAEDYFNKINKNKQIKCFSRGFIMGGHADSVQRKIAGKYGIKIKGVSRPVSLQDLIGAYKIIVVANDIPRIMFDYQLVDLQKKLEIWKIKDEQRQNPKNIEKTINQIIKKVQKLVKENEN